MPKIKTEGDHTNTGAFATLGEIFKAKVEQIELEKAERESAQGYQEAKLHMERLQKIAAAELLPTKGTH